MAITSLSSGGPRVILATSEVASCSAWGDDGGQTFAGDGAFLVLDVVPGEAGQEVIGTDHMTSPVTIAENDAGMNTVVPGEAVAQLTVWQNGTLVRDAEYATSGTISVNEYDPIGGVMGSYDLTFDGGDVEQGTFIAPACDPCTMSFKMP